MQIETYLSIFKDNITLTGLCGSGLLAITNYVDKVMSPWAGYMSAVCGIIMVILGMVEMYKKIKLRDLEIDREMRQLEREERGDFTDYTEEE